MRTLTLVFFIGILISLSSCRTDFETVASSGDLGFSKDTVYLDTVFTNIGSSTYNLKVYNRSNKDITIPSIKLENGLNSRFRMTIDGMRGNEGRAFENVTLLAKDSLYIFIETTANITDGYVRPEDKNKYLYTDKILFASVGKTQEVELATIIQDAVFIFPNKPLDTGIKETLSLVGLNGVEGHELLTDNELNWTKEKPYVIYGYAAVPNGKTLTINEGTRVYFHAESGLAIDNGATLKIEGKLNETNTKGEIINFREVTFEGDRLEPDFEEIPGQWGTILLFSSANNTINHLTVKNATIGLYLQTNVSENIPKLKIDNSQFYNCSNVGILARNADIIGTNLVINGGGLSSLWCSMGGTYDFTHCTFNNNFISSKQTAVLVDNYYLDEKNKEISFDLNKANFKNCIIYGSNNVELFLDKDETAEFNTSFENCLIKFNDIDTGIEKNILYNFIRNEESGNIKNKDPKFFKQNQNKLNIDETSAAYQKGNDYGIETDILGTTRPTTTPDIGAYQSASFPK